MTPLRTPVLLAKSYSVIGAKPCILQFDPDSKVVSLDSVDGHTHHFGILLSEAQKSCRIKNTPQINITVDGTAYILLFETQGQSIKRAWLGNLWQFGWFGKTTYTTPGSKAYQQWTQLLKPRK